MATRADPDGASAFMIVYLFGYLSDDVLGRVLFTRNDLTVAQLAAQLTAWGPAADRPGGASVVNEAGEALNRAATIAEAGLENGDIFTVVQGGEG
jgi:hypothetical protein